MPETTWADTLEMALGGALAEAIAALPRLAGALILVTAGWFLAGRLARATERGLEALRLSDWLSRCGLEQAIASSGMRVEPREVIAGLVRWGMVLVAALGALDVLGLASLASALTTVAAYLPRAVAAILLLIIGLALAKGAEGALRRADVAGGQRLSIVLPRILIGLVSVGCLSQLQLVPPMIQAIVVTVLGTAGLGLAIAGGLALHGTIESLVQGREVRNSCQIGDWLSLQTHDGETCSGRIECLDPTAMHLRTPSGVLLVPYRALAGRPFVVRPTGAADHSTAGSAASASTSDDSDFLLSRSVTTDEARELESS